MTSYNPVIKNSATGAVIYTALEPRLAVGTFQGNPTLATGDVKISIDGGAFANLATLPDVEPDSGKAVRIILSQAEVNGDNLVILFSDAAGDEWCDQLIHIRTVAANFDTLPVAVWAAATRTLSALDEDATTLDLDATIRAALGMAAADLDDQLEALPTTMQNFEVAAGITFVQLLRGLGALLLGKSSGGNTATEVFRDLADSKAALTFTVDENGNRSAVARDLT